MGHDVIDDQILLKSDGYPTYHLANVVDDHDMRITNVARGEDHLYNTLRQILVYEAMQVNPPRFAHLPLILAEDRSKLSKRHGASSIGELRKIGYLPGAVVNYLTLLGWSHPDGQELLTVEDLKHAFSLDRVGKAGAVYDGTKLRWMNGQYLRQLSGDVFFRLAGAYLPDFIRNDYPEDKQREIVDVLQDGLEILSELAAASAPFRRPPVIDEEAAAALRGEGAAEVLAAVDERIKAVSDALTPESFKAAMKDAGKAAGVKGKALFFPVRAALTGAVHGPDLASVAVIKGRDSVVEHIERAREMTS